MEQKARAIICLILALQVIGYGFKIVPGSYPHTMGNNSDNLQSIIEGRRTHPGLVHIFSAMETCIICKSWHDKQAGKTFVKNDSGKCLHYYFYFIDPDFGLCYLRVPTWSPFRLQFYMNGHNWLASRLSKQGITYQMRDNASLRMDNWVKAQ